jgi:N-methylhydantoinase A
VVERQVSMRYRGQGWEIPVAVPDGPFTAEAARALTQTFVATYRRYFGRAIDGLAIEAVSWAVRVASMVDPPDPVGVREPGQPVAVQATRPMYDAATGAVADAAVVERTDLVPGDTVAGPAVIVETQTTTVLASTHQAVVQDDHTLRVTRTGGAGQATPAQPGTAPPAETTTENADRGGTRP